MWWCLRQLFQHSLLTLHGVLSLWLENLPTLFSLPMQVATIESTSNGRGKYWCINTHTTVVTKSRSQFHRHLCMTKYASVIYTMPYFAHTHEVTTSIEQFAWNVEWRLTRRMTSAFIFFRWSWTLSMMYREVRTSWCAIVYQWQNKQAKFLRPLLRLPFFSCGANSRKVTWFGPLAHSHCIMVCH